MRTFRILLCVFFLGTGLSACAELSERPLKTEYNTRPELGVRLRVMPSNGLPEDIKAQQAQVLLVVRVQPTGPAAGAGLKEGDIILKLDGQPIMGMVDSVALMQNRLWGDFVNITILRDGQRQDVNVFLQP